MALSRGASSLSLPPITAADAAAGGSPSSSSAAAEDPMKRAPPGCVRSTFRAPSVADPSPLWAAQWPHDDVKIWVGTYNVSKVR